MINKDNEEDPPQPLNENKPVDIAECDIQCHIFIKDIDTGELIVNKRG